MAASISPSVSSESHLLTTEKAQPKIDIRLYKAPLLKVWSTFSMLTPPKQKLPAIYNLVHENTSERTGENEFDWPK